MSRLSLHRLVTGVVAIMGLGLAVRELWAWSRSGEAENLMLAATVAAFAVLLVFYLRKLNRFLHREEPEKTSLPREIGDVGEGGGGRGEES